LDLRPYYNEDIEYIDHVVLQHECEVREFLLHILAESKIRNVIEIGTWEGGTAYIWAQLVDRYDGHVFCIDTKFGSIGGSETFRECGAPNNIEPVYLGTRFEDRVVEIHGRAEDPKVLEALSFLLGETKVDLLFHDGDHHYEAAKKDIERYSRFVREDGWIAICDWAEPLHGIGQYYEEFVRGKEHYEFLLQDMPPEKRKSHRPTIYRNGIGIVRNI